MIKHIDINFLDFFFVGVETLFKFEEDEENKGDKKNDL